MKAIIIASALVAASLGAAQADEFAIKVKPAPGSELVQTQCAACHSLDYIQMNSPFPKREVWEAEVRKMIKVMGAPVADEEFQPIVNYLTRYYGTGQ